MSSLDKMKWLDKNPTRIKPVYGYLGHPILWAFKTCDGWYVKPALGEAITAAMANSDASVCPSKTCPFHSKEPWPSGTDRFMAIPHPEEVACWLDANGMPDEAVRVRDIAARASNSGGAAS